MAISRAARTSASSSPSAGSRERARSASRGSPGLRIELRLEGYLEVLGEPRAIAAQLGQDLSRGPCPLCRRARQRRHVKKELVDLTKRSNSPRRPKAKGKGEALMVAASSHQQAVKDEASRHQSRVEGKIPQPQQLGLGREISEQLQQQQPVTPAETPFEAGTMGSWNSTKTQRGFRV